MSLAFINILKEKIFKKKVQNEPSLISEYYYPKSGCGQVYEKLSQNIINKNCKKYAFKRIYFLIL